MDKGECPGVERHLPDDIKNSPQYVASTTWGKRPSPGSHASQRESGWREIREGSHIALIHDEHQRAREESSGSGSQ